AIALLPVIFREQRCPRPGGESNRKAPPAASLRLQPSARHPFHDLFLNMPHRKTIFRHSTGLPRSADALARSDSLINCKKFPVLREFRPCCKTTLHSTDGRPRAAPPDHRPKGRAAPSAGRCGFGAARATLRSPGRAAPC